MFLSVLDKKRINLLKELEFLEKYGFYLAGGTAMALQIGHRTSLDFDFYTKKKFDNNILFSELEEQFKKVVLIQSAEQTLIVKIDDVEVSFFYYQYPLILPPVNFQGVNLASKEDIAAMKIIAISQRGTHRDFIDIYFLLKTFSLKEILEFVKRKYPNFNIYIALQGLTYFVDVEKEQKRKLYLIKEVSWSEIKKFLINEVRDYQRKWLI